jgi:starvation-inducible outer membrane lipoprotein
MKHKTIITLFIFTLLMLQGCVTQVIGLAASTTVAVASVPVKMSAAAAAAVTSTVIETIIGD